MTDYNAHRVFVDAPENADYIHNITLPKKRVDDLRKARELIRSTLREAVPGWSGHVRREALFEAATVPGASPSMTKPKFRMQGSMAYDTLNAPAQLPTQKIDADDGLFLPVSYFQKGGVLHPSVLSSGLFMLVEKALEPLCKEQGWRLDRSKPTCVRVIIDDLAHVDLALYAIPDSDYQVLVEAAKAPRTETYAADFAEAIELSESLYQRIPRDHIVLAHRTENWKPSDPRKLEDWFKRAVADYGEQLRRVCRYLKGWRDFQWAKCKLSSIALMRCVVDAYKTVGDKIPASRDDLALLRVAELLPSLLAARVQNPVVKGQYLDEEWTPEYRQVYVTHARQLAAAVAGALRTTAGAADLLRQLRGEFGERIPDDVSLVRDLDVPGGSGATGGGLLKRLGDTTGARHAVEKNGGGRYA